MTDQWVVCEAFDGATDERTLAESRQYTRIEYAYSGMARDAGIAIEEAPYSFDEWKADAASGRLKEVFACGTAAVVAAIGEIRFTGGVQQIGDGQDGPTTQRLRAQLTGLQRGTEADPHNWRHAIDMG